jgi:predicted ATPase
MVASFREDRAICGCANAHGIRRVVLTGGPGAGKSAVLELVKHSFCSHVMTLPESAGIVFGGGFPRHTDVNASQSAQRAIFYVQHELENFAEGMNTAVTLCDRGTVDGGAYWTGKPDLWTSVGTTLPLQLNRYAAVIHMLVPSADEGYNHSNPLRMETPSEAAAIDQRIATLWAKHPHRFTVDPADSFLSKATRVLEILKELVPECCRRHITQLKGDVP